jgi:hypothetical protein
MIPPSSVPLSLFFASTNAFTSKILNTILNQIELGKSNLHMNENEDFSLDYCIPDWKTICAINQMKMNSTSVWSTIHTS